MKEKIIETKQCKKCNISFDITDKDLEFYDKVSPKLNNQVYNIDIPENCPKCRRQQRLAFRNVQKLFRRKCDFSGEFIFSSYNDDVIHPVYDLEIWNSDKWESLDFGREFDFSKSFFEQISELKNVVPHYSKSVINIENSDYSNNASALKNCYLCFNGGNSEDCYYDIMFKDSKNVIDCYSVDLSENCYDCIDIERCNKLFYSQNCNICINSYFLKNCDGVNNCFLSKNLINKEYYILNESYSKKDYKVKVKEYFEKYNILELKEIFKNFAKQYPEKFRKGNNNENVDGNYINHSKNVFSSYDIIDCEDIKYCTNIKNKSNTLMDVDIFGWELYNSYNSIVVGYKASNLFCCLDSWENVSNLFYCIMCVKNTNNCFGCVGLKNKQYCILNKQYTKDVYNELIIKIIKFMKSTGEWGKFFPANLSSYGYNQTEGNLVDYINKNDAISRGFNWSDYESPVPNVEKIIPANKLPDNICDIPDDILNWAIECEETSTPFRIIKQELEFYRKHNLPIPKRHPDLRHLDRMKLRNPRKVFDRDCDNCGINMKTTYNPNRNEIVYCEKCYNKEFY